MDTSQAVLTQQAQAGGHRGLSVRSGTVPKIGVLHLIKTLNLGGAETNLFNLVQAMNSNRFDLHVGYSFGGEIENRFKTASTVKLFKYSEKSHRVQSLESLKIVFRLAQYIRKNKIQIIHTHNFNSHIWGLIAGKLTGAKVIEHVHDFRYLETDDFEKRRGVSRQYAYMKYLKNTSDRVLVLTSQNRQFLENNGYYPNRKIREVKNGINFLPSEIWDPKKTELRKKYDLPEKAKIIFTAARMAPEKNIDLIFRIAPAVIREIPEAVFVISGDGPLLESFHSLNERLHLTRHIRFVGFQSEIRDFLAISDIFLLPSFLELHSIAVLEAMSMKVPVVISKEVGCHDEFILDWESGVLLDPFSDKGWPEAVITLLKQDELRTRLGENGNSLCRERFNLDQVARTIEGFYAELAARKA